MISRLVGLCSRHSTAAQAAATGVSHHVEYFDAQRRWMASEGASTSDASSSSSTARSAPSSSSRGGTRGGADTSSSGGGRGVPAAAAAAAGPWVDSAQAGGALPSLLGPRAKAPPLPLLEALDVVKARARAKFDETVEAHLRLKVDPRRGDQVVRGAAVLPHGSGRAVRVAVFAGGEAAEAARAAGADVVGGDELVAALVESKGRTIDFDRAVGHPSMMPSLVRAAKILGPKGLMPNPKVGTLTPDVAAAVREMRRGRVEFKVDRGANIHAPIGRVSMPRAQLQANLGALTAALLRAKPAAIKGGLAKYVAKVTVCSTMGPGVEVEPSSLMAALDAAAKAEGGGGGEGGNKAAAAASA